MNRHGFARLVEAAARSVRGRERQRVDDAGRSADSGYECQRVDSTGPLAGARSHRMDISAQRIVIEETEPTRFMAAFAVAARSEVEVFLADPTWGASARAEFTALRPPSKPAETASRGGWLMISSGGTGGRLKFARHDEATIGAAVRGFREHFAVDRVNAVGVLPLHHVSGLMAWMRCALSGGEYVPWDWKQLEAGELPPMSPARGWFISLVPTQLQRLLDSPHNVEWLRRFRAIFLGGGPAWPQLLDAAAAARLPIAISYGMTETAAMVAALRPREFLAGERSCGPALPHARLALGEEGVVRIGGNSVFRGYYPAWRDADDFETEDIGAIDERGHLTILGRRDAVIITGGKKVHPAEVENALRASGEFTDVVVIGVPDPEWGQAVVACYPAGESRPNLARATAGLAAHQRPKRFVALTDWPRNEQGKVNRAALRLSVLAGAKRRRSR